MAPIHLEIMLPDLVEMRLFIGFLVVYIIVRFVKELIPFI